MLFAGYKFLFIFINFRILVPEDTFFDMEDGNTRNLRLDLRMENGSAIRNMWLRFDAKKQAIYALWVNVKKYCVHKLNCYWNWLYFSKQQFFFLRFKKITFILDLFYDWDYIQLNQTFETSIMQSKHSLLYLISYYVEH